MGKRKFYFFDLVYFVGERLHQLFPGRRSIDGVLLIPLGIMFLLGYCLNLLNITLLHFTGWKEKTVICVPILLSYIIVYYIYQVRGHHSRVMTHYRGSIYDSPPTLLFVFFAWMIIPNILLLLLINFVE